MSIYGGSSISDDGWESFSSNGAKALQLSFQRGLLCHICFLSLVAKLFFSKASLAYNAATVFIVFISLALL